MDVKNVQYNKRKGGRRQNGGSVGIEEKEKGQITGKRKVSKRK